MNFGISIWPFNLTWPMSSGVYWFFFRIFWPREPWCLDLWISWRVKWSIFLYKKINFILEIQIKAHFVELFILNNFKEATYSLKFHLHLLQHDLDTSFLHFRPVVESRFIASNQFGNRFSLSSYFFMHLLMILVLKYTILL